jgi:hypothetical protein
MAKDVPHALREGLFENIVIELVEQIFPVRPAGEKSCDPVPHGSYRNTPSRQTAKRGDNLIIGLGVGTHGVT